MQLKPDLVRAVLLEVEKLEYDHSLSLLGLHRVSLENGYKEVEAVYTARKLGEAGFILGSFSGHIEVDELTFNGHMFLETIKDNNVWNQTKNKASKFAGVSFDILKEIATSIIKKQYDLS